jgi:predicted nucleotidyltransferase
MKASNIKERIKEFFFTNPNARLRVRGIEKKLKLPLPSIIRYCKELEKEEILITIKTGNVVFYTADKTSHDFLLEKKLYNIKSLYVSGLIEFIKVELNNPPIIVFGSYSKGEDVENSDIDLYIETPASKKINLNDFENKLSRKMQAFQYKGLKDIRNMNLANNIINGIILNGYIEVFK